ISHAAFAEIIYLNDGQVITGAVIAENADELTVKTAYQTRKIKRSDVTRILYGERTMEKTYFLMNDGTTMTGFLVDQDAEKVIIREKEDSKEEKIISKKLIKQMSGSEIVPLEPSIVVKGGAFYVFNSGGASLKPSYLVTVGSDINFRWVHNMRVGADVGFSRCSGKSDGLYMQFVPLLAGGTYDFAYSQFHIVPRLYLGMTMIDFDNGEGSSSRSFAFTADPGCGFVYEIAERHFYAGLWLDGSYMRDRSGALYGASGLVSRTYRF
ncbi:MAG: hypothetical protein ACRCUT_13525, partial [Spirochaetota bacterium]